MKTITTAVLALSLIAGNASAATQPNPSTKQRELALEMLRLSNSDQLALSTLDAYFAQMQKTAAEAAKTDPDRAAEIEQMFTRVRELATKMDLSDLQDAQIRIWAKYFTESELAQLVEFQRSAVGRKQTEVMPALMGEMMNLGGEMISPKIEVIFTQAVKEFERSKPWRGTMTSMESIGLALELYAAEHDGLYPRSSTFGALLKELSDEELPKKDVWENEFAYVVSADAKHYRLVSSGGDSNFEFDSRTIVPAKEGEEVATRYRERLEDDIIYADGSFVQAPKVAAPKTREPK